MNPLALPASIKTRLSDILLARREFALERYHAPTLLYVARGLWLDLLMESVEPFDSPPVIFGMEVRLDEHLPPEGWRVDG